MTETGALPANTTARKKRLGLPSIRFYRRILITAAVAWLAIFAMNQLIVPELGVTGMKLKACPNSPNCVATQQCNPEQMMDPWPMAGTRANSRRSIERALAKLPRCSIVSASPEYIHATQTSLIFRFVDDIEFLIDEAEGKIHFRSASRIGKSDLGVNRKRMEKLASLYRQEAGFQETAPGDSE